GAIDRTLDAASRADDRATQAIVEAYLAPLLHGSRQTAVVDDAFRIAQDLALPALRFSVLAHLVPLLADSQKDAVRHALSAPGAIDSIAAGQADERARVTALAGLISLLAPPDAAGLLAEALTIARGIDASRPYDRASALLELVAACTG